MIKLDSLLNFGSKNIVDVNTIRLIRQVNGLNLFFTFIALSVGLIFLIFISNTRGTLVLGYVQMIALCLYFSNYLLSGFGKLKIARKLTLYIFEWHLFVVTVLTNASKSAVLPVIILFPLLAALVEESIFRHMFVGFFQLLLLVAVHFFLPDIENKLLAFSNIPDSIAYILVIMGLGYFPFMASVIMKIIFTENLRAREKQKEMQKKETIFEENKKYLDNINEGLLLINRSFTISNQFSKFTLSLFDDKNIAGMNLIDVIYPDVRTREKERAEIEKYLRILFDNKTASMTALREVNPLFEKTVKIKGTGDTGNERDLAITFQRIFNGDDIENIMVLFEDKTNILKKELELKNEKIRKDRELETLSVILKQGPQVFYELIQDTYKAVDEFKTSIDVINNFEVINHLFRQLHSLKSLSKALELNFLAEMLHLGEGLLEMIRKKDIVDETAIKLEVYSFSGMIYKELKNIEVLIDKILMFRSFDKLPETDKSKILLTNFIDTLHDMVRKLSKEFKKEIEFESHSTLEEFPLLNTLKSSIIHLVRNAIDHGIEDIFERLSKNKNKRGTIRLGLYKDDKNYFVEVSDDGGNIDYEVIRKKAIEKNLIRKDDTSITKESLLRLMFSPQFSSREHVTDISGRGVGLNVVKTVVGKLNGKIKVTAVKAKETKFTLIIPVNGSQRA